MKYSNAHSTAVVSGLNIGFWPLGVGLFALGNVLNFVAFSLAPASLLAPIGSIQVKYWSYLPISSIQYVVFVE